MAVNNIAELRHRVEEDSYELIRNTPVIGEGVRQPSMRRAKRCWKHKGKNWALLC